MVSKVTIKDVTKGIALQILKEIKNSIPETEVWDIAIKILYGLIKSGIDLSTLKTLANSYYNIDGFKTLLLSKIGNGISISINVNGNNNIQSNNVQNQINNTQLDNVPDFIRDNPWVSILQNRSNQ